MLDYTKAAIKKTVDDFKRLDYIRNVATQILYIVYLIYALFAGAGILWANISLLSVSTAYFFFFLFMTRCNQKPLKVFVATLFKRCKQVVRLATLGIMVYGIYAATKHVTAPAVIFTAFLIVGWLLQIVFEVVFKFFINRAQFILEGIEADYEQLTKPAKAVSNFFKKLTGKEVEEKKQPSKQRVWLEEKVAANRVEKQAKKITEKRLKQQAKIDRKNTRFLSPPNEEQTENVSPVYEEIVEEMPSLPDKKSGN